MEDPLLACLQDPDYEELLGVMAKGLPVTNSPQHVAIVGGGIAGLTAAKLLESVGHKVHFPGLSANALGSPMSNEAGEIQVHAKTVLHLSFVN